MKNKFYKLVERYVTQQDGVTGLEYGILAGGVAMASLTAVVFIGEDISGMFETFSGYLQNEQDV